MAPRVERKLAAILAADVVGYSRLVGSDEAGTIARLKALRKELIEPLIAEYHGRLVKLMGDGFDTVLGRISFDDKGDVRGFEPFVWYGWKDGDYAPVDPVEPTD